MGGVVVEVVVGPSLVVESRRLIFTDSNRMSATAESIKSYIPAAERSDYDIDVVAAFTTVGAWNRVNSED